MKIEKINDRQIRCTLTKEDLANRQIKLSELAYGSEKAKALFQDMMQIAADDFGFEADNIPLVIEAVPVSMDTLILIITKVEDPDELDTRFARFSPEDAQPQDPGTTFADLTEKMEGADDILDLIKKISEVKKRALEKVNGKADPKAPAKEAEAAVHAEAVEEELSNLTRAYLFFSLDDAIRAARIVSTIYDGPNSLFKNKENGNYYLLLKKASSSAEEFNKVCNILSEYALSCKFSNGLDAYFEEHMETIIKDQALQNLYQLG